MPDPVAAAARFSDSPAWVLLDEFACIGHRRNHTTAASSTSARRPIEVSFVPLDPPRVSRWFVYCPGPMTNRVFNGMPRIINAADSLVVMRMLFFDADGNGGSTVDYFVYRAGPGTPSLHLVPGPCPKVSFPKQVAVLPCGFDAGEHYSLVFPVKRLEPASMVYELHIFSSESQAWSTKIARISTDTETSYQDIMLHDPSKAIATGGSSLAWIDLWRGILLCTGLDKEEAALRLIQWPVPSIGHELMDLCAANSVRDAMLSNGVIRFVEVKFQHHGDAFSSRSNKEKCWRVTVWKGDMSSKNWDKCFEVDIAKILAAHYSQQSHLPQKMLDNKCRKLDFGKVLSAAPVLSLSNEDVVYFMTNLDSGESLLLAVDTNSEKLEDIQQTYFELGCSACAFSRFLTEVEVSSQLEDIRRENLEPHALYKTLLMARDQLMKLGGCVLFGSASYHECRSLIGTGPAACLYANFHPTQYSSKILGQAASKDAATYIRAIEDIDDLAARSDLPALKEAIARNIYVALVALDNLMQAILENMSGDETTLSDVLLSCESVYGDIVEEVMQYDNSNTMDQATFLSYILDMRNDYDRTGA
ncbi:hypothetical protein ACP4OV_015275 [Aristida adscensionis]